MYKNILITNENNEGEGITKVNGKVVFVPFAIKDDIIDLEIVKNNKNYDIGELINLVKQSKNRSTPKCKYYYDCGGCNLMHMNYDYELNFKKNKVINNLKKISNIEIDNIDIIYDKEFNYRNHITLSVKNDKIGFLKENSNEIIDIDYCLISNDIINKKISEIKAFINKYRHNNIDKISIKSYKDILINIESKNFNLTSEFIEFVKCDSLFLNDKLIYGKEECDIVFDRFKFKISSKSFFQKNTEMALKLYNYVKDNVKENTKVLDLYCGIGSIGIFISDKAKEVVGIELIDDAILNAKENAKINGINNIKFISGKVEDNIDSFHNIDTIIVDPPRTGLNRKVIDNILKIGPKDLIYVSCNSTTLARDLNYLKDKYEIKSIKLFDLFSRTHHVECVCVLTRKDFKR